MEIAGRGWEFSHFFGSSGTPFGGRAFCCGTVKLGPKRSGGAITAGGGGGGGGWTWEKLLFFFGNEGKRELHWLIQDRFTNTHQMMEGKREGK